MCIRDSFISEDFSAANANIVNQERKTAAAELAPRVNLPLTVAVSGEGSFVSPFMVNVSDPLVRAVNFYLLGDCSINEGSENLLSTPNATIRIAGGTYSIEKFVNLMNRYLRQLDFSAPKHIFCGKGMKLVRFLRKWNEFVFRRNNLFVIFESTLTIPNRNAKRDQLVPRSHDLEVNQLNTSLSDKEARKVLERLYLHKRHLSSGAEVTFALKFTEDFAQDDKVYSFGGLMEFAEMTDSQLSFSRTPSVAVDFHDNEMSAMKSRLLKKMQVKSNPSEDRTAPQGRQGKSEENIPRRRPNHTFWENVVTAVSLGRWLLVRYHSRLLNKGLLVPLLWFHHVACLLSNLNFLTQSTEFKRWPEFYLPYPFAPLLVSVTGILWLTGRKRSLGKISTIAGAMWTVNCLISTIVAALCKFEATVARVLVLKMTVAFLTTALSANYLSYTEYLSSS
eukprot:TRINITY_DN3485_c0_g5_i1.p1 TRINITY_DN3485_c0_g5~~TRINITY_DN3485_c0_g5_i1.p1  ORF type:complete len:449 (-),score=105.04 TRINITY_DN3485_c0_g5_i1:89-1435(-)